jgi:fumarate hydratase subunit beta
MNMDIKLPLIYDKAKQLMCGDFVTISGKIFTARDASHKRMIETIDAGKALPFSIDGSVIYYCGPTPARPGQIIGSCGPTTSSRMDQYTPKLLELGLRGMIGKSNRSPEVIRAIQKYRATYFVAIGGCGALLSQHVLKSEVIAYEDLESEAIFCLTVSDFPVVVAIDTNGNNIYER